MRPLDFDGRTAKGSSPVTANFDVPEHLNSGRHCPRCDYPREDCPLVGAANQRAELDFKSGHGPGTEKEEPLPDPQLKAAVEVLQRKLAGERLAKEGTND